MLDIHSRLRHTTGELDPLKHVADDVAQGIKVLALDELFVTDVADAMILHRLFGRLWDNGLVLVATSNRAPDALYENGLQRQLFLPFIARLKVRTRLMLSGISNLMVLSLLLVIFQSMSCWCLLQISSMEGYDCKYHHIGASSIPRTVCCL